MARYIVLLLAGATIGGAITYALQDSFEPNSNTIGTAELDRADLSLTTRSTDATVNPADAAMLESLISETTGEPDSYARGFELEVWLAVLAESDPAGAVRLALERGLPERFIELAFKLWAESDSIAALDELSRIQQPMQRTIALALTDVLGADPAAIADLTSQMPGVDQISFQIDALRRVAARDPYAAIELGLNLPDPTARRLVFADLGMVWGRYDPEGALAALAAFPEIGARFKSQVLQEWSRLDVHGFLEYVVRDPVSFGTTGFDTVALNDPQAALAAAELITDPRLRQSLRIEALGALARRDPAAAISQLEASASESGREDLLRAVAASFAEVDPAGAVAWITSLDPPSSAARQGLLTAMAATDLESAVDFALASAAGFTESAAWFSIGLSEGPVLESSAYARIADKLSGSQHGAAADMFQLLGTEWTRSNPEGAIAWAIANGESGARMLSGIAAELGSRNIDRVLLLGNRLPPERYSDWIADAAGAHARIDPGAALRALERIREESEFADAVGMVVQRAAVRDVETTSSWVVRLPAGSARDAALGSLLQTTATMGIVDASWLIAFSSETAMQNALLNALPALSQTDLAEARLVVDTYIIDPELRLRADEAIENAGSRRAITIEGRSFLVPN